jgi:hypothetical protein
MSVLDDLQDDLQKISVSSAARIRSCSMSTRPSSSWSKTHGWRRKDSRSRRAPNRSWRQRENDNIPQISKMQIELLVNSFAADFNRIATLQYTNSVGGARMKWLGVEKGHHELSHEPDSNEEVQKQLTRINRWYCEQMAYLAKRLSETPEPAGNGSLLTTPRYVDERTGRNSFLDNVRSYWSAAADFKMGRLKYQASRSQSPLAVAGSRNGTRLEKLAIEIREDGPLTGLSWLCFWRTDSCLSPQPPARDARSWEQAFALPVFSLSC